MITKKETIIPVLREKGISPSYPRKRILEYLLQEHNHPTVSRIYQDLISEIPSLSKTTVYNTLKLFVDHHLVEEITIEGNEKRYDLYNPESHAHFRCERCSRIYDIELNNDWAGLNLQGFEVRRQSVHMSGLCAQCTRESGTQGI